MKSIFKFSKPKGPGFGISSEFYLTVACSTTTLPCPVEWANPKGADGGVRGFCVPLNRQADRTLLNKPMERGAYVLATEDKKTVLRALILPPDEAGFDAEAVALSRFAGFIEPEAMARLRGAWMLVQLSFQSHDPAVYPAVDFLEACADRIAALADGVVADAISERYLLPGQLRRSDRVDPKVDARELVTVRLRQQQADFHCYTLGMRTFALHELEIDSVKEDDLVRAEAFLLAACQSALMGAPIKPGERLGATKLPFDAQPGGLDRSLWEGIAVLELLPPTSISPHDALIEWEAAIRQFGKQDSR